MSDRPPYDLLLTWIGKALELAPETEPVAPNVVWNDGGVITLSVGIPPAFSDQPDDINVDEGDTATFSVTASNATGYQWQKQESGAGAWADISGATSASYTTGVLSVAADNTDKYRCVATGDGGTTTSNAATLTVQAIAAPSDYVDRWVGSAGIFSDLNGTTPQATDAGNILNWTGVNGTPLKSNYGASYYPTLRKDFHSSGVSSLRFQSKLLTSANIGPFNRRESSVFMVISFRDYAQISALSFLPTASDISFPELWLNGGRATPSVDSPGLYAAADIMRPPLDTFFVIGVVASPSSYYFVINDRRSATINAAFSSSSFPAIGLGVVSGVLCNFDCSSLIIYDRTLTSDEVTSTVADLMTTHSISATPVRVANVVFRGNSITEGASATRPFWHKAIVDANIATSDARVYGVSGATTPTLSAVDATLAPSLFVSGIPNVVVLWEGSNHLAANADAATAIAATASQVAIWQSAGFDVVVRTVMHRSSLFSGGADTASFNAARATYNSAIIANSFGADAIDDVASVANLADSTNTTYFSDGTHLKQAGHDAAVGNLVSILGTLT